MKIIMEVPIFCNDDSHNQYVLGIVQKEVESQAVPCPKMLIEHPGAGHSRKIESVTLALSGDPSEEDYYYVKLEPEFCAKKDYERVKSMYESHGWVVTFGASR